METISLTINSSWIVSYHWLISWAKVSRCKLEAKAHESRSWWVSGPQWDIMAQHFLGGCPKDTRQCVQVELHRSARTEAICSTVHTAPNWGKRIHNKSVSNLSNAAAAQNYKLVFSSRKQWMVLHWVRVFFLKKKSVVLLLFWPAFQNICSLRSWVNINNTTRNW